MSEIYAVAISPDKRYLVLQKETLYALIYRREGITVNTRWQQRILLSRMLIKGNYIMFKKPVRYKGLNY